MKRSLLKYVPLSNRYFRSSTSSGRNPVSSPLSLTPTISKLRFFSSEDDSSTENPKPPPPNASIIEPQKKEISLDVEDISNKEFHERIQKYFKGEDEEALPSIMEAVLTRRLLKKHEETDEMLMDELRFKPLDNVQDQEFESDFEELYETDEEIDNLTNADNYVMKKMVTDEYSHMDDRKWDEMIKEATERGYLKNMGECEQILEDMLNWDKLLPDEIKQKVEAKFNELGDMCERGELEPEEAYQLFKEFEDQMVTECMKMDSEEQPQFDVTTDPKKKADMDDPPGEGPILRWQTQIVLVPGGNSWHPKNRKVKMSVTVKELGLSKHAFRRLREIVGKRYHSGKDELTITSERFEHREENRKDCLRTLYALLDDAMKADELVEETRVSYARERLRANPAFMDRLRAKTLKLLESHSRSLT